MGCAEGQAWVRLRRDAPFQTPKRGVCRRGLRLGGYGAGELIQRAAQSKRAGSSVVSAPTRRPPRRPASSRNRAGLVRQIRTNASAPTPESFKSTAGSAGRTSRNTPGLCEDAPKIRRSRPSSGRCRLRSAICGSACGRRGGARAGWDSGCGVRVRKVFVMPPAHTSCPICQKLRSRSSPGACRRRPMHRTVAGRGAGGVPRLPGRFSAGFGVVILPTLAQCERHAGSVPGRHGQPFRGLRG
jgi:hypothetical protein